VTREWYSASDVAGLPGLPADRRNVRLQAARESWPYRERAGRGGGREYPVSCLPETARAELARRALAAELDQASPAIAAVQSFAGEMRAQADQSRQDRLKSKETGLAAFERLSETKRQRARARMRVLEACEQFLRQGQLAKRRGTALFAAEYSARRIELADWVREYVPRCDRATIYRWAKAEREQGLIGLSDGYGHNRGKSKVNANTTLAKLILGLMATTPTIRPGQVFDYLQAKDAELAAAVSLRGVQRWMAAWKLEHAQLWCLHTNPDAWKNQFQAAFGDAAASIIRLNQLWEMDTTPADLMLTDGRHSVIGVIDIFSRRFKLLVSKTSKATMVATLFRRATLVWGVPEGVRTDQGKDYTSQHLVDVLRSLEVEHKLCVPFASEQKPFIERSFKTFSHGLLELLPGFIGHSVAERKAIESRKSFAERIMEPGAVIEVKMSAAELQTFGDRWCEAIYAHSTHDGLAGKTPFQVVSTWSQPVRRIEDERALDVLLAEAPQGAGRTVTKKGLRIESAEFVHPELTGHIGERVKVKCDPDDLGRVYVYDGTGEQFICIAECPERLGIARVEVAAAARRRQKEALAEGRALLREAKKAFKAEDVVNVVLEHRLAEAAKVTMLPRASTPYTTPQLEAAGEAARAAGNAPEPQAHGPEATARTDALVHSLDEARRRKEELEEMDLRAWHRFCALMEAGDESWSADERRWMRDMDRDPYIQTKLKFEGLPVKAAVEA
jgi:hypothetical protein